MPVMRGSSAILNRPRVSLRSRSSILRSSASQRIVRNLTIWKRVSPSPDPRLAEEHRPGRAALDQDGDRCEERRQRDQQPPTPRPCRAPASSAATSASARSGERPAASRRRGRRTRRPTRARRTGVGSTLTLIAARLEDTDRVDHVGRVGVSVRDDHAVEVAAAEVLTELVCVLAAGGDAAERDHGDEFGARASGGTRASALRAGHGGVADEHAPLARRRSRERRDAPSSGRHDAAHIGAQRRGSSRWRSSCPACRPGRRCRPS